MAKYIITDNGQGEIAAYDDKTETFGPKTYHVYNETNRRNYPYAEFYKRVFYEDKYNIISSITISPNTTSSDEMCYVSSGGHDSITSTFNASDYYKIEIKRFLYDYDEDNTPRYEEYTDTYYIRKRSNERLMSGIKIRSDCQKSLHDEKQRKIATIKKNIDRKHKIRKATDTIITDYFETDGKFSDETLGKITTRELKQEMVSHRDRVGEEISKKWSVTDNLRKISNTATATGIVGSGIATAVSSSQVNEFTIGPIILGLGTVFITHHILKNLRMSLVDTKIGQIERDYHKANYEHVTGRRK